MARRTIVLVVALALAGVAALSVWQFLGNVVAEAEAEVEYVEVYRTTDFIAEGIEGDLVLSQAGRIEISKEERRFLPASAVGSVEDLQRALSGRVAAGPISANSIITGDQWVPLTVDIKPLAEQIPSGKQAMTISVDDEKGVNGFIEPGDRVNVIVTIDVQLDLGNVAGGTGSDFGTETTTPDGEQTAQLEARTISRFVLQGLPVLAVGREIRPDAEEPIKVTVAPAATAEETQEVRIGLLTLEVSPEQAERLAYTMENGSVWLTLVPVDFVETPTDGITLCTLFPDLGALAEEFPGLESQCATN